MYAWPKFSETASAAAQAIWFVPETAKFSNVKPGLTRAYLSVLLNTSSDGTGFVNKGSSKVSFFFKPGFCLTKKERSFVSPVI